MSPVVRGICAGHNSAQAWHEMHSQTESWATTFSNIPARSAAIILCGGKSIKWPTGHVPLQSPHWRQARIRSPFSTSYKRRRVASVNDGRGSVVTVIAPQPLAVGVSEVSCDCIHKVVLI